MKMSIYVLAGFVLMSCDSSDSKVENNTSQDEPKREESKKLPQEKSQMISDSTQIFQIKAGSKIKILRDIKSTSLSVHFQGGRQLAGLANWNEPYCSFIRSEASDSIDLKKDEVLEIKSVEAELSQHLAERDAQVFLRLNHSVIFLRCTLRLSNGELRTLTYKDMRDVMGSFVDIVDYNILEPRLVRLESNPSEALTSQLSLPFTVNFAESLHEIRSSIYFQNGAIGTGLNEDEAFCAISGLNQNDYEGEVDWLNINWTNDSTSQGGFRMSLWFSFLSNGASRVGYCYDRNSIGRLKTLQGLSQIFGNHLTIQRNLRVPYLDVVPR